MRREHLMEQTTAVQIHNERVIRDLEQRMNNIEAWTQEQARKLQITEPVRRAVQRTYDKLICGRKYLLVPRHTPIQRRFLRMMLTLALATDSSLQSSARRVAAYFSQNYAFEWCSSPITAPARRMARDMILRAADAQFDETPYAPQLAYVVFHHQKLQVTNVSDYTELYTRALALDAEGLFRDVGMAERRELGLHRHPYIQEHRLRSE